VLRRKVEKSSSRIIFCIISLEPETQTVWSRTRRYSERTCLSRIVLRAARSAPSTFVAELKRSAKLLRNSIRLVSVLRVLCD
jgi:hypothetical protein